MDTEALRQRLMGTFARELDEHVATLNSCLIELEKSSEGPERDELVRTLFRSAHSIKGAARMVGLQKVEKTSHELEESLAQLRDREATLSAELIRFFFSSVDSIERAGAELAVSRPGAEGEAANPPPQARPEVGGTGSSRVVPIDRLEPMVRVDAQKLEDLVRANGETMVARRRMTRRIEELEGLQDRVDAWTSQWLRGETALRQHLNGNGANATADRSATAAAGLVEQNRVFLRRLGAELERITEAVTADHRQMERVALPLQDQIHQMRMQPLRLAAEPLQRAVRDVAREAGKEVDLTVRGGDIELDRSILEALGSPLLHLVRNAIDHGIESPEGRRQKGKPDAGRVVIEASLEGSGVTIEISDDGQGIDLAALRRKAEERGLDVSNDEDLTELIFHPGLSTARSVTAVSGRGIGLDVVRSRVESLHGTVSVATEPGKGTRFRMTLPLTLTTIRALLVRSGGETLAIPSVGIEAIQRVDRSEIRSMEGRDVLITSSGPVPLVPLAHLLDLPAAAEVRELLQVVRVRVEPREVGLVVDESIQEQELIVKSLGPRLPGIRGVSGATLLPTGQIALILNVPELIQLATKAPAATIPKPDRERKVRRRLIVADDSVTTRTLVKSILEAAGYEILAAADGEEAWQILQQRGADLVVSDVEMPRLDGIGLTKLIRSSSRFRRTPVVLVTARDSEEDKARGAEAGADMYLVKTSFDQKSLLEAVKRLL